MPECLISPPLPELHSGQIQPLCLGVLASGSGSNFEAIATAIAAQKLQATIKVLIYNNPQAYVAERADRWQVPKVLLNHRDYSSRVDLDAAIVAVLHEYGVDWVAMAGWMRIVTPVLIDAYPQRIVNIHPSLLPAFKGIGAIEQAIAAQVKISGCTVHLVAPEVDSGPIVMQSAVPVLPEDTVETLHQRIQVQEHLIFPAALQYLCQNAHHGA